MTLRFRMTDLLASLLFAACAFTLLPICAEIEADSRLPIGIASTLFFTGASFGSLFKLSWNFGCFFLVAAACLYCFFAVILKSIIAYVVH